MKYKSFLQKHHKEVFENHYFIGLNLRGRRLVIPDIHGHNETLKALIQKIALTKQDYLFFLGDYIDRGEDSVGVIQTILDLIDEDYQIFPLKGNHEEKIIQKHRLVEDLTTPILEEPNEMIDEIGRIYPKYASFFKYLPFYYEMEDCYLVHGGFDFSKTRPFEDYENMLWIRDFTNPTAKRIVRGHVVCALSVMQRQIQAREAIINLDNGIYYQKTLDQLSLALDLGNLCCLDLDSFDLVIQENVG